MTKRLATCLFVGLLVAPIVPLPAQDHPRAQQQSQSQQLPQSAKGAAQATMTEATKSSRANGVKEVTSGDGARSADQKLHMPYQRKDLALDLVRVHDDRFSSVGGNKYFACVDMKGADGRMYDIDFMMMVQGNKL